MERSASGNGMQWVIPDFIVERHLRCVGHTKEARQTKEMWRKRSFHGPKKRWKDLVMTDFESRMDGTRGVRSKQSGVQHLGKRLTKWLLAVRRRPAVKGTLQVRKSDHEGTVYSSGI